MLLQEDDTQKLLVARVQESIDVKASMLRDESLLAGVTSVASVIAAAIESGNQILLFGNGGSAADATHVAGEYVGRFKLHRPAMAAMSLTDNVAALTAIGNDYAYDMVFTRQIEAFGQPGDVAVALSTSGTSRNVVMGLQAAVAANLRTVAFTGASGGDCLGLAELCVRIPSDDTARVQECTLLLCHAVCECVERRMADR